MDTVSTDQDVVSDDIEDEIEATLAGGEVSHEFVQYQNNDLDAFCWAPWRMLKIDIRARTSICCDFAHRLPSFDWPTAKTFHAETGMWNHPYMQHMRTTMGKEDELPFCTVCRTTDKRDPKNAQIRRDAMRDTQKIYSGFLERIEAAKAHGSVDRYALKPATFASRLTAKVDAAVLRPIVRDRSSFRKLVRNRGFADRRRVLQIGSRNGTITPYLAEKAEAVVVVDVRQSMLDRVAEIAAVLEFSNVAVSLVPDAARLPFEEASFDGVWLDGRLLTTIGRRAMLTEIKRVLAPGGRLSAVHCFGPGGVIEQVAKEAIKASDATAALAGGVSFDGRGSFVTSITVLTALKGTGLGSDRTCPPTGTRFDNDEGAPILRTDYADLARYLDPRNRHAGFFGDGKTLQGVERSVTFTAIKDPEEGSRHHRHH